MPRFLRRKVRTVESERTRVYKRVESGYKRWVDPYPFIQGTLPEKMVYAELSRRNIPFWFQNEIDFNIPELDLSKQYRPDIAIPSMKTIIEVQGSYWHSQPEAIEADAYKMAIYEMLGWRVLVWWDYDIESRLHELFAEQSIFAAFPLLDTNTKITETSNGRKREIDDSKGIRTMNYNRGQRQAYKRKPVSIVSRNKAGRRGSIVVK